MSLGSAVRRHLTDEQISAYRREGYLAVPGVIDAGRLAELRNVTSEFVERSRGVGRSDEVFDLDPRHTASAPILRRIKNPADNDPLYRWVAFDSPIPDIVADLLGPDVKFHHGKLNLKGRLIGAPVEWHQDAAFYPHSNDDVLAVGLLLDDATRPPAGASGRERPHPPLPAVPLVSPEHVSGRPAAPDQLLQRRRLRVPGGRHHPLAALRGDRAGPASPGRLPRGWRDPHAARLQPGLHVHLRTPAPDGSGRGHGLHVHVDRERGRASS